MTLRYPTGWLIFTHRVESIVMVGSTPLTFQQRITAKSNSLIMYADVVGIANVDLTQAVHGTNWATPRYVTFHYSHKTMRWKDR